MNGRELASVGVSMDERLRGLDEIEILSSNLRETKKNTVIN